ncbi:DUF3253 domain-containing protein [Roseomonas sp. NAR14]|uniref:DUF3253 domain-containing protein n=1 Tax=Roseomonas acroporae TaxID=2937791 RepID=A0A9X1Y4I9_9PROT|nr:DUF3253 domain-containing protein [Roseomonas acroporae]MCK8783007.1 DUF3253 domain-containing protein [Roseomonas acroporae]
MTTPDPDADALPDRTDPGPGRPEPARAGTPRPASPRPPSPGVLRDEILRQTAARGPQHSICPSEVARALDPDGWRSLLGPVRAEAAALAREGCIEVLRKGKPVQPEAMRGVLRLRAR